jgi:hypothetical protein
MYVHYEYTYFLEKNKILNEFKFPDIGIGIFILFNTSGLVELSAFKNLVFLFESAHSD